MSSDWVWAINAAATGQGIDAVDNASVTNPTTQITRACTRILRALAGGTNLAIRLSIPSAASITTSCSLAVFGRCGDSGEWQRLRNRNNLSSVTFTLPTSPVVNGSLKSSEVDNLNHLFDCQGCDQFLIGVETALALSGGNAYDSVLSAKIF
jgi:hypothetical protein